MPIRWLNGESVGRARRGAWPLGSVGLLGLQKRRVGGSVGREHWRSAPKNCWMGEGLFCAYENWTPGAEAQGP